MTASHSKALAFPGLITGLLKSQGVVVPSQPLRSIRKPITADYIRINCLERGAQIPPPPRRQAPTSTTESRLLAKMTLIEQQNSTILQQNLSNHLAMLSLNNSFYLQHQQQYFGGPSFDWPNPEQFATLVQWPGGSPYFQRGAEHHEAAAEGGTVLYTEGDGENLEEGVVDQGGAGAQGPEAGGGEDFGQQED